MSGTHQSAPALIVEALFQLANLVRKLVEKLHAAHQALGLLTLGVGVCTVFSDPMVDVLS